MRKKDLELTLKVLNKFNSFLIAIHENPDGDAIGSALGLGMALEKIGKKVSYFKNNAEIPASLNFLGELSRFQNKIKEKNFDVLVALDASEEKRLILPHGIRCKILLNIDHHPQNKPFGRVNLVSEMASATAELVYLVVKELTQIDAKIANALLCGIFTDTGSFQHANTTPHTMEVAADLMRSGANLNKIAQETFQNKTLSALKLWGLALARIKQDKEKGVTLSAITQKDLKTLGAKPEDLEGVVNVLNTAAGTKYALLLLEQAGNKIKASLRSEEGRGINVAKIAKRYGGGGHALASGFTIKGKLARKNGKWVIKK